MNLSRDCHGTIDQDTAVNDDAGAGSAAYFCANPDCVLHIQPGDPGVHGRGEWAVRADGIRTSRSLYGGRMLCDLCGRAWVAGRLDPPA